MINPFNKNKIKQGEIHFQPINSNPFFSESKPTPAIRHFPKWYKEIPRNYQPSANAIAKNPTRLTAMPAGTIKKCVPVMDGMSAGYIYSTPVEVIFDSKSATFAWAHDFEFIQWHQKEQLDGWQATDEYVPIPFKWRNLNIIKTPPGWSCLFTHPLNRNELPFRTFSGVVDTDSYNLPVHFPFQLVSKEKNFIIEKGTPVCQIIPFKREDWKSSIEKPNHKEQEYMGFELVSKISRSYKTQYWKKKKFQ